MPTLLWDEVGTRMYETGVDRGVLYLQDGSAVPWNGLTSVTEKIAGAEGAPIYFDGVKYGDALAIGDFSASLKAYTYPDEFMEVEGVSDAGNGLYLGNQQTTRFGLSYRTKIGNDEEGIDFGYKIHVLYNLTAIPVQKSFRATLNAPVEFEWNITSVPEKVPGFRATAHLIFDTRFMSPFLLQDIEDTLYGDGITEPRLPSLSTLVTFASSWVIIRITDNGDGTWTAEGPDEMFSMLDATTFQITQANAEYLDADTYTVSDSTY